MTFPTGPASRSFFPAWMQYVYKHNTGRFVQFAMRVFDVEYRPEDPKWTIMQGILRLKAFLKSIGMPVTLRELGIIDKKYLDEMAKAAADHSGGSVGRFVVLKEKDIRKIFEIAY